MYGYDSGSSFGNPATLEVEKYLYVQLKMLNFVEVAYIENRISDDVYKSKVNGIMNKISTLKAQIPNFNVDNYFKVGRGE